MLLAIGFVAIVTALVVRSVRKRSSGRLFIEEYRFPDALRDKLRERHEHLTDADVDRVLEGLRDWFRLSKRANGQMLGMPSRVVDDAWHEFILMTRVYHQFCDGAFGRYLHHTPNAVAGKPVTDAIPRTLALLEKDAPPSADGSLPRLFTIDGELDVARGRRWDRNSLAPGATAVVVEVGHGDGCLGAGDTGGDGCGADGCGGCCGGCCG